MSVHTSDQQETAVSSGLPLDAFEHDVNSSSIMVEDTCNVYSARPTQTAIEHNQGFMKTPYTSPTRQGKHHPIFSPQMQGGLSTSQMAKSPLQYLMYGGGISSAISPAPNSSIAITQHKSYQARATHQAQKLSLRKVRFLLDNETSTSASELASASTDGMNVSTTEKPRMSRQRPPEWLRLRELLAEDCTGSMPSRVFSGATKEQLCMILRAYPLPTVFRRDEESWQQVLDHQYEAFSQSILESQEDDLKSGFPHDGNRAGKHIESEIRGAMPMMLAWFHTKLSDTALEMSIQSRAGGSLLDYLRLPSSLIETELFDWVRFHIRARAMTPDDDDKLDHALADSPDSSCASIVPLILIGAIRPDCDDDTAAEAIQRLKNCLEDVCENRLQMLENRNIPQSWVGRARNLLKKLDSMYALYLESFITRVASAARNAGSKKPGGASPAKPFSPKKQKLSTVPSSAMSPTKKEAPLLLRLANNSSPAKARTSHTIPTASPNRGSSLAARTTIAPKSSTPTDVLIASQNGHKQIKVDLSSTTTLSQPPTPHQLDPALFRALTRAEEQHSIRQEQAQKKIEERVYGRHPASMHTAGSLWTSEITPGIVKKRQSTYGSPIKKARAVSAKPAWR